MNLFEDSIKVSGLHKSAPLALEVIRPCLCEYLVLMSTTFNSTKNLT